MYARQDVPEALDRLATHQAGVVTREQVSGHGLSDHVVARLVRSGSWQALARGVYAVAPGPPSWEALAWSGVLLGGDAARLGPRASGYLHQVLTEPPPVIDVLVPVAGPYRTSGAWSWVRERPGVRSPRSAGSPPRLRIEDAVIDLAATAGPREVIDLVTRAVQQRRTQPSRLAAVLAERQRHPHRQLLRDLLSDVAEGAESPLEVTYLRDVERAHDLPRGERQLSRRGLAYVSDVGYDAWRLLVELDGRIGHEGMGRFRDMDRDNRLALTALLTLRYGWWDVHERPCVVAVQVGAGLQQRGWPGLPKRCPRCLRASDADLWATV